MSKLKLWRFGKLRCWLRGRHIHGDHERMVKCVYGCYGFATHCWCCGVAYEARHYNKTGCPIHNPHSPAMNAHSVPPQADKELGS